MFSIRLLCLDHYICKPIPELLSNYDDNDKTLPPSEPVLRIYGPTSSGEKACVHIHGVFPYLYVPYEGGENPDRDALLLAAGLDRALAACNQQNERFKGSNQRFVHRVRLVSGIPIYGYHSRPRQFFKVYFFNPYSIRKAADLLLSGAILNLKLQPHETHIPFTQQFMIDFNLFGMSMVNFKKVKFRQNPSVPESLSGIDTEFILPSRIKKSSHCHIEVDVLAEDILNRSEDCNAAANPGLAGIWEEERARRRLKGRLSEPTQPNSDPRSVHPPQGVEVEYLKDLRERIVKISAVGEKVCFNEELKTPYPAELPEDSVMLEASILDSGTPDKDVELYKLEDNLVNEAIVLELSQRLVDLPDVVGVEDESSDSGDEPGAGRGDGVDPEEELDMTQPLSPPAPADERWTAVSERECRGNRSSESEEEFWREMADDVLQLDGAGDSDCDAELSQMCSPEPLTNLPNNVLAFLDEHCLDLPTSQGLPPMWDIPNTWSPWPCSPLPSVLTPVSNLNPSEECLMDALNEFDPDTPDSATSDSNLNTFDVSNNGASNPDIWNNLKALVNSRTNGVNSITLQEYLKGDIVHVDFKVINSKEMVVIEYSPYEMHKNLQNQNKFLIKPLYEFIDEWNKAEISNANNNNQQPKYIHGFTPVKQKKIVPKKLPRKENIDKECQTLLQNDQFGADTGEDNNKSYKINESFISKKKIVLKLVTSQSTFQENILETNGEPATVVNIGEETSLSGESLFTDSCPNPKTSDRKHSTVQRGLLHKPQLDQVKCNTSDGDTLIPKIDPDVVDVHDELVRNVNEKFEEYYQRLIGKKKTASNASVKIEHEVIDVTDSSTDCDTETSYTSNGCKTKVTRKKSKKRSSSPRTRTVNPIDFVSQILTSYSKMPKTSNFPPVSITVNIGDPNLPVRVNVHSNRYFDGPDDSSSDDSSERRPRRKKTKYRPLEVLVEESPIRSRRKRKDVSPSPLGCSSQSDTYFSPKTESHPFPKSSAFSPCFSSCEHAKRTKSEKEGETRESIEVKSYKVRRSRRQAEKLASSLVAEKLEYPHQADISEPALGQELPNIEAEHIPQTDMLESSSDDQSLRRKRPKSMSSRIKASAPEVDKLTLANAFTQVNRSEECRKFWEPSETNENYSELQLKRDKPENSFVNLSGEVAGKKMFIYSCVPPTKSEILNSLNECDQLETTGTVPHYSNIKDATKHIEVGNKVLKLEHKFCNIPPHHSTLPITGIEQLRKDALGGQDLPKVTLVKDGLVVLTPVWPPPTRIDVLNSLQHTEKVTKVVTPRVKRLMPGGEDSDSGDGDVTLSFTPCSPSISSGVSPSCTPTTPQLRNISPVVESASASKLKRRVSFGDTETINLQSTPTSRRRSSLLDGEDNHRRKGPLDRLRSKRRLVLNLLQGSRRVSTDSNKSTDIFDSEKVETDRASENITTHHSGNVKNRSCQIQGVSLDNTFGFKTSLQNFQDARPNQNFQFTSLLVMEVLTDTRGDMMPDPQLDSILAIFFALVQDFPEHIVPPYQYGVFTVGSPLAGAAVNMKIESFADEKCLLEHLVTKVKIWDPDFVAGYEIEKGSWGYVLQRAYVLGMNLLPHLGRTIKEETTIANAGWEDDTDDVPKIIKHLRIPGRVVLNVWRLLRHEIALTSYSFENIMFHLLHERHAQLSNRLLAQLWKHRHRHVHYIPADYCMRRIKGVCRILAQLDLLSRNSELAKVFGIQFEEVLSRGSQFRVESMMLRLAKPANFVPVSPDIQQRAHMRAPGSLPLIMEPESRFYADPVIVLDFQSLYPSMIIAHNYCFSTCLGRVTHLGKGSEPFEFGCTRLSVPSEDLVALADDDNIHVSPAGVAFVTANVRKGILPSMLEEILETRLMVKKSMKENRDDKLLQKVLHARQLGLKLIANVTYGYTAANFSGRMPCIEVGDSVVSKGRETLQRAIRLVQSTARWGARVVYGDTDSLFVLTAGRTRQQAFQIGEEIANAVTQDNPRPVKLKLEKVYQPCILQTKKRYVGYMYENADQERPVYEAKGIETVRRDGCPATAKILQKALHILFDTGNVSLVKKYTLQQFAKIFQGRASLQDLIFAKEYRGRRGYRPGACVPALQLAKQWTSVDRRAEPRNKERVPYVIVHGAPGVPLIRLVRSPRQLLTDTSLRVHAAYYITKAIIPALQRCFTLIGADPLAWYAQMPRRYHRMVRSGLSGGDNRATISQYLASLECVACGRLSPQRICSRCLSQPSQLVTALTNKIRKWERAQCSVNDVEYSSGNVYLKQGKWR